MIRNAELMALAALVLGVTAWSWHQPADRLTWWLEALPVLIALPLLAATRARFPLTRIAYWLIAAHGLVLLVGAHYTYARVPLGFWMEEAFGSWRAIARIDMLRRGYPMLADLESLADKLKLDNVETDLLQPMLHKHHSRKTW